MPSGTLKALSRYTGVSVISCALAAPSAGKATRVWAAISASPLSEEGQAPVFAAIGRVNAKRGTPGVSILALCAWSALLTLSGRYDDLFNLVIFASWILYGMTAAAVLVLRKKQPDLRRPYRTAGYPYVPSLFILAACVLLVSTACQRPRESAMGISLIAVGLPFYFYWKRRGMRPN